MNLKRLFNSYALLFMERKRKILIWPWWTTVSILIANQGIPPIIPSLITILSVLAIATCVYIYNNVRDIEMDQFNPEKLNRPLPSGKVSKMEAMSFVYLTGLVGIVLSLQTNFFTFFLSMAFMALFIAYSHPRIYLKKKFLLKEGTIALGTIFVSLIGGITAGTIPLAVVFSGVFLSVGMFVGLPTFTDVEDVKEDSTFGVKTLAMVLNWKTRVELLILFVLIIMTTTPLTYKYFQLNVIFPIIVVASCLLFLRFLFPLLSHMELRGKTFQRALKSSIIYFLSIQIALILGSVPLL